MKAFQASNRSERKQLMKETEANQQAEAEEKLSIAEIKEMMGMNKRGLSRGKGGAWRQK